MTNCQQKLPATFLIVPFPNILQQNQTDIIFLKFIKQAFLLFLFDIFKFMNYYLSKITLYNFYEVYLLHERKIHKIEEVFPTSRNQKLDKAYKKTL